MVCIILIFFIIYYILRGCPPENQAEPSRRQYRGVTDWAHKLQSVTAWSSIVKYAVILMQMYFLCVSQGEALKAIIAPFLTKN